MFNYILSTKIDSLTMSNSLERGTISVFKCNKAKNNYSLMFILLETEVRIFYRLIVIETMEKVISVSTSLEVVVKEYSYLEYVGSLC